MMIEARPHDESQALLKHPEEEGLSHIAGTAVQAQSYLPAIVLRLSGASECGAALRAVV
jgi:hypothetical protein